MTRKAGWLNSTVFCIAIASLFSDVGHEMATTAMPMLLASLSANSAALRLIEGLADVFSSFAKLLSGLYSDRLARRHRDIARWRSHHRHDAPESRSRPTVARVLAAARFSRHGRIGFVLAT